MAACTTLRLDILHLLYIKHEPSCKHSFEYDSQHSSCAPMGEPRAQCPQNLAQTANTGLEKHDFDLGGQDFIKVSQSFISVFTGPISSAATNAKLHHLATPFPHLSTFNPHNNAKYLFRSEFKQSNLTVLSCKGWLSWGVPVVESL